eukprot:14759756-Alexandrium_andersonii.AAC.1
MRHSPCCSGCSAQARAKARAANPAPPQFLAGLCPRAAPRLRGRALSKGDVGSATKWGTVPRSAPSR